MGQRVKIQYTIDLDDYEKLTQDRIANAFDILRSLNVEVPIPLLSLETVRELSRLREALATADFILADSCALINDYVTYIASDNSRLPQQQDEVDEQFVADADALDRELDGPPPQQDTDTEKLARKVKDFKHLVDRGPPEGEEDPPGTE